MRDETRDLITRARHGDETALARIFEGYRARIQGLVRKKLGDQLRANLESSDVVQSVCLEAMKGIASLDYQDEDGFVHWLARITENTIRDKHRYYGAAKRTPDGEAGDEGMPLSQAEAPSPSPSRAVGNVEQMDVVLGALKRLPEEYRRVIVLTRFEKKTHEETARLMGRTEKATRMLLARARTRLLRELDDGLE